MRSLVGLPCPLQRRLNFSIHLFLGSLHNIGYRSGLDEFFQAVAEKYPRSAVVQVRGSGFTEQIGEIDFARSYAAHQTLEFLDTHHEHV